jgi:hypothetical protein
MLLVDTMLLPRLLAPSSMVLVSLTKLALSMYPTFTGGSRAMLLVQLTLDMISPTLLPALAAESLTRTQAYLMPVLSFLPRLLSPFTAGV